MKTKVLEILKKEDGYLSGEALSAELGMTRSAVWKYMKMLKQDGYVIDSVRNKGYRLLDSPDLLEQEEIRRYLKTAVIGQRLVILKSVDSTNDEAKRLVRNNHDDGIVVVAEEQFAGKGRLGRKWSSGSDGGLYFSVVMRPELPPSDIASITLASGYAVCLAIREFTGLDARIKWPNDVVIGRKKVCGILTEMSAQSDRIECVITGIGVNVNQSSFSREIADRATSLRLEARRSFNRSEFLAVLLNMLEKVMDVFLVSLSADDMTDFRQLCVTLGRPVTIHRGNTELSGMAVDISPRGDLIVRTDQGDVTVNSGEVTVQGIY